MIANLETAGRPTLEFETVSGAKYVLFGADALAMSAILAGRGTGCTQAEAHAIGGKVELLWHRLRKEFPALEISRAGGRYTLVSPVRIVDFDSIPEISAEIQFYWENQHAVAAAAWEKARVEEERAAAQIRPRAVLQTSEGRKTFYGQIAHELAKFDYDHRNVELTPSTVAVLGSLVKKATWCGSGHRLYHLAPGVLVAETENCEPVRRIR